MTILLACLGLLLGVFFVMLLPRFRWRKDEITLVVTGKLWELDKPTFSEDERLKAILDFAQKKDLHWPSRYFYRRIPDSKLKKLEQLVHDNPSLDNFISEFKGSLWEERIWKWNSSEVVKNGRNQVIRITHGPWSAMFIGLRSEKIIQQELFSYDEEVLVAYKKHPHPVQMNHYLLKRYHANGKVKEIHDKYIDGKLTGHLKTFNSDGHLLKSQEFRAGEELTNTSAPQQIKND
jgi:hypothetical protein